MLHRTAQVHIRHVDVAGGAGTVHGYARLDASAEAVDIVIVHRLAMLGSHPTGSSRSTPSR